MRACSSSACSRRVTAGGTDAASRSRTSRSAVTGVNATRRRGARRRLRRAAGPEGGLDLSIATAYETAQITLGASIACSGVCLTVVAVEPGAFSAQASAETLACSTLGRWTEGAAVNLERALRVGDELGGHIVSGHVDGVARIVDRRPEGESVRILTAHRSKGLEWDLVVVAGVQEGTWPGLRMRSSLLGMDELVEVAGQGRLSHGHTVIGQQSRELGLRADLVTTQELDDPLLLTLGAPHELVVTRHLQAEQAGTDGDDPERDADGKDDDAALHRVSSRKITCPTLAGSRPSSSCARRANLSGWAR